MMFNPLVSWLLVAGATTIAAIPAKRATEATVSGVTLYAYGKTIAGRPILADSNGYAYVSNAAVQPANLSSVSFTISTTGTADWTATLNSTNSTTTTPAGNFYIIPTTSAYEPVGLTLNATTPTGAVTGPFLTYGQVVEYELDETLVSQFWAEGVEGTDQYLIRWNSDGDLQSGAQPVTLKTTAPTS